MKLLYALLVSILTIGASQAQDDPRYTGPVFTGGLDALAKFLQRNMKYPSNDRTFGNEGTVLIKYKIHANNSIDSISIVNSVSTGIDREALRVFKMTSGMWTTKNPGFYLIPFKFKISPDEDVDAIKRDVALRIQEHDYHSALVGLNEIRKRAPFDIDNLNNLISTYGKLGQTANEVKTQELKREIEYDNSKSSISRQRKLTGRLLDTQTQKPLKNANIIVQGTTIGTFSNHLGFFELTIDTVLHKKLVTSHIGYSTSVFPIPKDDKFKFLLEKGITRLNKINLTRYPKNNGDLPVAEAKGTSEEFMILESGATFPGGMNNFYTFIGNGLVKDKNKVTQKGFNINFSIDEKGNPIDVSTSDSTQISKNDIAALFKTLPVWTPATQRQVNVRQYFSVPVVNVAVPPNGTIASKELYSFLSRNIKYPPPARAFGRQGAVYVEFRVDDSGTLVSALVLQGIDGACDFEVVNAIRTMPSAYLKSLTDETGSSTFLIPVFFGIGKPFENTSNYVPESDALVMTAFQITAIGIEKGTSPGKLTPVSSYTNLDHALENRKYVKRLSLINMELNIFPPEILKLSTIEILDLERNHLTALPSTIEVLTDLQELYFFENKIESLPATFSNLKKLKILGLSSNHLKVFPQPITLLEKLEILDLASNELSSIPTGIGNLKNLKVLALQNNSIKNIPQELYGLKKLEKIYLQGNPIDPAEIELLKKALKKAEIVVK